MTGPATPLSEQLCTRPDSRRQSIDALSGWIVNRKHNHVVLAKIAQRVLLAGSYLADSARRDGSRLSVDRYVPCSAQEVEQMAPRFDVRHRMIARFETNQFGIEGAAIIIVRQRLVFEAARSRKSA